MDASPERPRGERLDSWKEIAAYLKRDVATVRRWERREALPVHRHLHEKLASVSAYTSELDALGRRAPPDSGPGASTDTAWSRFIEAAARPAGIGGRGAVPWMAAGALAFALVLAVALWAPWNRRRAGAVASQRGSGFRQPARALQRAVRGAAVLSPDGPSWCLSRRRPAPPQLYVRRLDQLQAEPLPAPTTPSVLSSRPTDGGSDSSPAASSRRSPLSGGAAVTLADAMSNRGGSWSEDGTIVFSPNQTTGTRLLRISSAGGAAEPLTALAEGEVIQIWPQVLPGGKAVLYTSSGITGAYNDADLVVQVLPGGPRKVVQRGGYHGRYLASGHLVYVHDGTLFAAPFDLDRLEVTGQPIAALQGVNANAVTGGAQFAASAGGTLVYLPGPVTGAGMPIHWMAPRERTTPLLAAPANWSTPRFAPNGRQLAMEIRAASSDIWVYEWARDTLTRLTSGPAPDQRPVWTPDSRRIAFASPRADTLTPNLYWQRADGTGDAERLTESTNAQQPSSWHPSGRFLAFEETTTDTKVDVMILPLEGDDASGWKPGTAHRVLEWAYVEFDPMFSPDGRWLAYASVESGHPEVYVRPFPGPGAGG